MYFSNKSDKTKIIALQNELEQLKSAKDSSSELDKLKSENEDLRSQLNLLKEQTDALIDSLKAELEISKKTQVETIKEEPAVEEDLLPSEVDVFENQSEEEETDSALDSVKEKTTGRGRRKKQ